MASDGRKLPLDGEQVGMTMPIELQRIRNAIERISREDAQLLSEADLAAIADLYVGLTNSLDTMIDRVMPPDDGDYHGCPLCDYTGHWNCTIGTRDDQRELVRDLLRRALGLKA